MAGGDKIYLVVFYCLHIALTHESPRIVCMVRDIRTDYGCLISHLLNVYDIQISHKEIYAMQIIVDSTGELQY